jgi:hypothetical protein
MKKLKQQYRCYIERREWDYIWKVYPNVRSGTHKHFSTKQEKSFYFMHLVECKGYPVKLRAARGKALTKILGMIILLLFIMWQRVGNIILKGVINIISKKHPISHPLIGCFSF